VADRLENERHARRGVLQVGGQRSGVARAGRAGGFAVLVIGCRGAPPWERQFGVDDPDQALAGEQRESPRVVQDFGQREFRQVVLAHRVGGHGREQRVLDAAAFVGFRTEQQGGRRHGSLFHAGLELRGRHQNFSSMALTTLLATLLLRRSMAVPLSSK
jgi:hypothetical protein